MKQWRKETESDAKHREPAIAKTDNAPYGFSPARPWALSPSAAKAPKTTLRQTPVFVSAYP